MLIVFIGNYQQESNACKKTKTGTISNTMKPNGTREELKSYKHNITNDMNYSTGQKKDMV